jgi:hypothetical protein
MMTVGKMRVKTGLFLVPIFSLLQLSFSDAAAEHGKSYTSPYGDYCRKYSHYGSNKVMHSHRHAEKALRHYFKGKGLDIKLLIRKDRFIKVNIMKNNEIVDTIIFDRRTGRIRSIN